MGAYIVQNLADVGERLVAVDAVVFVVEVVLGFGEDVLVVIDCCARRDVHDSLLGCRWKLGEQTA